MLNLWNVRFNIQKKIITVIKIIKVQHVLFSAALVIFVFAFFLFWNSKEAFSDTFIIKSVNFENKKTCSDFNNPISLSDMMVFQGFDNLDKSRTIFFLKESNPYKILSFQNTKFLERNLNFYSPIVFKNNLYFASNGDSNANAQSLFCFDGKKLEEIALQYENDPCFGFISPIVYQGNIYFVSYTKSGQCLLNQLFGKSIKTLLTLGDKNSIEIKNLTIIGNKLILPQKNRENNLSTLYEFDGKLFRISDLNTFITSVDSLFVSNSCTVVYDKSKNVLISNMESIKTYKSDYQYGFSSMIAYKNRVIFEGNNAVTNKIYAINNNFINNIPFEKSDYLSSFRNPIVLYNKLFFEGKSKKGLQKIYCYDGEQIYNILPELIDPYEYGFENPLIYQNAIVFMGKNANNSQTYIYNGKTIQKLKSGKSGYSGEYNATSMFAGKIYLNGKSKSSNPLEQFQLFCIE